MKANKTKAFDLRQAHSVVYGTARFSDTVSRALLGTKLKTLLLLLLSVSALLAQNRQVDPTWLRRYIPQLSDAAAELSSASCHFRPIFGEGDAQNRILLSVTRFAEVTLDPRGSCPTALYDRQEEIDFVLEGTGVLHYGGGIYAMRANDFTYLPPGVRHSLANTSDHTLRVLVMSFKIPSTISIGAPSAQPKIVNLDSVQEETVEGHPTSVLYKLLLGSRTAKRDAIDEAYVVTSFFWMDFAPGATNFPHHHETAEEIYLVLDGQGQMVAGSGMDGVEGRYPSRAGDAYYFRPNCTVGFYNQDRPGARAHILAVRSKIPLPQEED
jgi:mannose-6-phosphate isomerase-like protein (cupin superfamily)